MQVNVQFLVGVLVYGSESATKRTAGKEDLSEGMATTSGFFQGKVQGISIRPLKRGVTLTPQTITP